MRPLRTAAQLRASLPVPVLRAVEAHEEARTEVGEAEERAAGSLKNVVTRLVDAGYSTGEAAILLGLSRTWIDQVRKGKR